MFRLGTDGPAVLRDVAGMRDVAGHREGDPHDRHRGQKQRTIQNTHRGQNNKPGRAEWPPTG
ncbi:MAG: hypothetical protein WBD32_02465 [Acidobacteriaceae bacterium]